MLNNPTIHISDDDGFDLEVTKRQLPFAITMGAMTLAITLTNGNGNGAAAALATEAAEIDLPFDSDFIPDWAGYVTQCNDGRWMAWDDKPERVRSTARRPKHRAADGCKWSNGRDGRGEYVRDARGSFVKTAVNANEVAGQIFAV